MSTDLTCGVCGGEPCHQAISNVNLCDECMKIVDKHEREEAIAMLFVKFPGLRERARK